MYKDVTFGGSPLLNIRMGIAATEIGETVEDLPLLERLLRCAHEKAHEAIAGILWER